MDMNSLGHFLPNCTVNKYGFIINFSFCLFNFNHLTRILDLKIFLPRDLRWENSEKKLRF